ncbi:TetR/AcrR family transcriptional regulator [Sphaerisporangium perillae]|uniref:TetR/AcrR family transcriptional regulator n=1 Tax=Sphaerisporangium perillae TaxID=2935860 RepID=UPI00200C673E|nr:hypothetical protein [Sphaerisporangium perillae]
MPSHSAPAALAPDGAIKRHRTADATVTVTVDGVPPAGQEVVVAQRQHRFLFGCAVQAIPMAEGDPDAGELIERLLETLGVKLSGLPPTSLAMMRSMLTHPEAASSARAALGGQIDQIGAALPGDDARLRAALVTSVMIGVTIGHQLLDLDPLRDAPREEIERLMRPCLLALLHPA